MLAAVTQREYMSEEEHTQPGIWERVEQATFADDPVARTRLIRELALQPKEVMMALQQLSYYPPKQHWRVISQVVGAIGYPQNVAAIPLIIAIATDPNAPGQEEATATLCEIGPEIVVPYLIEILWDRGQKRQGWDEEVYEVCWWLERGVKERAYLLGCGPVLAFLLSQRQVWKDMDEADALERALIAALVAIAAEGADYVLPALLAWLEQEGPTALSKHIQVAITSLGSEVLRPYTRIWPYTPGQGT